MYEQGRAKQKLRTQGSGLVGERVDWGDAQVRGGDSGVMEDAGEGVGRIGVTHLLPKRTGGLKLASGGHGTDPPPNRVGYSVDRRNPLACLNLPV